jgi:hypothetical protein
LPCIHKEIQKLSVRKLQSDHRATKERVQSDRKMQSDCKMIASDKSDYKAINGQLQCDSKAAAKQLSAIMRLKVITKP